MPKNNHALLLLIILYSLLLTGCSSIEFTKTYKNNDSVISVDFSPDGETLLSGSRDNSLKLWSRHTGKLIRTFTGHTNWVRSVAFSPDGETLLSGSDDYSLKLWNRHTGKLIRTFTGHTGYVNSVAFSPDGETLLSGSKDKSLKLWNRHTSKLIRTFTGHTGYVNSVAFSPDGKTLLSGSYDKSLKLWNRHTGKLIRTFTGHTFYVNSVAFSPDGETLLSGSDDYSLKLWNRHTGKPIRTFTGHSNRVKSVAFSPDGETLLSGSWDNSLKLWNRHTGKLIRTFTGHTGDVNSVAFSPDGETLLSGSRDESLKLWDASEYSASGKAFHTLRLTPAQRKKITSSEQVLFLRLSHAEQQSFLQLSTAELRHGYLLSAPKWNELTVTVTEAMQVYLNPAFPTSTPPLVPSIKEPALIPEPKLPQVIAPKKDVFESRSMFNARLAKMTRQREAQIEQLMRPYREKVKTRNVVVNQRQTEYNQRYALYLKQVKSFEKQEQAKLKVHKKLLAIRRQTANREKKEQDLFREHYATYFGTPKIKALTENGAAKYDAETGSLYALVYWGNVATPTHSEEVVFNLPATERQAAGFYKALLAQNITPQVHLNFSQRQFALNTLKVTYNQKDFSAKLNQLKSDSYQLPLLAKIEPSIKQSYLPIKQLNIDTKVAQKMRLQALTVKDVKFELVLDKELRDFNDLEIRRLVAEYPTASPDESKWLFVVGIENYQSTDKINFAKRSAELFIETAMKTQGIPAHNVYFITDDGKTQLDRIKNRTYRASAGSFSDQFRYLTRDIKQDDTIYFYYNGHGVPVTQDNNAPYLMARDMTADFLADEKFFKADNIYQSLAKSRAGQVFVFMDSCFTGVTDGRSVFGGNKAATRLAPKKVRLTTSNIAILTAGTDKQYSNAYTAKGHRLFSYYLIKSFLNKHKTIKGLFTEVANNTSKVSRQLGGEHLQTPVLIGNAGLRL